MSLIYSVYSNALERFHLTEDDADQCERFPVLRGEVEGKADQAAVAGATFGFLCWTAFSTSRRFKARSCDCSFLRSPQ